jgi:dipeptidyl aminopeptidase/acylaminoacyl peptidase
MCTAGRTLASAQASPDGSQVAVHVVDGAGSRLVVVPAEGGPERVVAVDPPPTAFCWTADGACLVTATADRRLCLTPLSGGPGRTIAQHDDRLSAPAVSPDGTRVAYVADDRQVLVVRLDGVEPPVTVSGAADFAFDPAWSPDSRTLVWHEWDVPDMPWDGGRIVTSDGRVVAEGGVQQPRFSADGRLGYLSDESGWLNVHVEGRPLVSEPFEHGDPAWGQGQRSWCWSPEGREAAFNRNESGFGRLVVSDGAGGVRELGKGVHRSITWSPSGIYAIRTGAKTPTQLVRYRPAGDRTVLAQGPVAGFEPALVEPEVVTEPVPGLRYRPRQPNGGLLVQVHGGPVGQNQVIFDAKTAYWLDRGWTVLVPDFRGSTGHGRAYQQAVNGGWGEVDVEDVAAAVRAECARAGISSRQTVLVGGSSGGMTVLLLLARHPDLAAGGIVNYPVVDLVGLARTTHRFEAHGYDRLIGTSPRLLKQRSPITHADRITKPVLVFHGLADEVVPPRQSRALVRRLRANGVDVEHVEYPGEGHGFRRPENLQNQLLRMEAWLGRVVVDPPNGGYSRDS